MSGWVIVDAETWSADGYYTQSLAEHVLQEMKAEFPQRQFFLLYAAKDAAPIPDSRFIANADWYN